MKQRSERRFKQTKAFSLTLSFSATRKHARSARLVTVRAISNAAAPGVSPGIINRDKGFKRESN